MATAGDGWSVIVCGDLPQPVAVYVPDPLCWTISQLKIQVESKTKLPTSDYALFCDEELLPDEATIANCKGMKNGVAVCLVCTAKDFVINVQRVDSEITLKFQLPLMEAKKWSIQALRQLICYRFSVPFNDPHTLAIKGEILEDTKDDKPLTVGDYVLDQLISPGCLVTLTLLSRVTLCKPYSPHLKDNPSIILPLNTSEEFANEKVCYNRLHPAGKDKNDLEPPGDENSLQEAADSQVPFCTHIWNVGWTIYIKQLSGNKTEINIDDAEPGSIPVFYFREIVSKKLSVPTYQQRLVFDDTVMNDWSECGTRLQLLSDYYLHDGDTICLITLTNGICVIMPDMQHFSEYDRPYYVDYINIPCPNQTTVEQLELLLKTNLSIDGNKPISIHEHGCYKVGHSYFEPTSWHSHKSLGSKCDPQTLLTSLSWLQNNYKL